LHMRAKWYTMVWTICLACFISSNCRKQNKLPPKAVMSVLPASLKQWARVKAIMDFPVPARLKSQYMVWLSNEESLAHIDILSKMHLHIPGVQTAWRSDHCSSPSRWYLWLATFNALRCFMNICCQMVCIEYGSRDKTTYPHVLLNFVHHLVDPEISHQLSQWEKQSTTG
jgi:hypothetical protein